MQKPDLMFIQWLIHYFFLFFYIKFNLRYEMLAPFHLGLVLGVKLWSQNTLTVQIKVSHSYTLLQELDMTHCSKSSTAK